MLEQFVHSQSCQTLSYTHASIEQRSKLCVQDDDSDTDPLSARPIREVLLHRQEQTRLQAISDI